MKVPQTLAILADNRRRGLSESQAGVPWSKTPWKKYFPEHAGFFDNLPNQPLQRSEILQACSSADRSPDDAVQAFLAAMAWGYGPIGYGPWRTKRMFDEDSDAGDRLHQVARSLISDGSVEAYRLLANSCRLKWLGPAYGTKFLYFCPQAPDRPPGLILDRLVARWLRQHEVLDLSAAHWSTLTYENYVHAMRSWANELDLQPGELEEAIFVQAREEARKELRGRFTDG